MNWREIFKRYVEIVEWREGVTFLDESEWTEAEYAEISKAVDEVWAQRTPAPSLMQEPLVTRMDYIL